ncbi:MAG: DEAD/DEAH box helicase [Methanoregula sp.]|nr:MAG: DEAD/DEAH box helicase [Methanoregula sp.]
METSFSFKNFSISPKILRAIEDMGFEEPTPIQTSAIPIILAGNDVTGQAKTGTGKTAAFGIPALERLDPRDRQTQVIILSPTRELAIQTAEEIALLAAHMAHTTVLPIYGGQPIERQLRSLKTGVQIVVGTPGRVLDHLRRRTLSLSRVKMVVLDEADQMLDMGFLPDIETIIGQTPKDRQTILFSATLPKPILAISRRFQKNPEFVEIPHKELTVPQVEQRYVEVHSRDKFDILCRLLDQMDPKLVLVFCNTKRRVDQLTKRLKTLGYRVGEIHGDLKQSQRDRVMAQFRKGEIDLLVATDVAARGIDVDDIDLVVNLDVPQVAEYYVHRIGRTARAGRSGRAITFVGPEDVYKMREIQRIANITISRIPIPSARDAAESRIKALADKIKQTIDAGNLDKQLETIERIMVDDYTSLEIAAALLKLQMDAGSQG